MKSRKLYSAKVYLWLGWNEPGNRNASSVISGIRYQSFSCHFIFYGCRWDYRILVSSLCVVFHTHTGISHISLQTRWSHRQSVEDLALLMFTPCLALNLWFLELCFRNGRKFSFPTPVLNLCTWYTTRKHNINRVYGMAQIYSMSCLNLTYVTKAEGTAKLPIIVKKILTNLWSQKEV